MKIKDSNCRNLKSIIWSEHIIPFLKDIFFKYLKLDRAKYMVKLISIILVFISGIYCNHVWNKSQNETYLRIKHGVNILLEQNFSILSNYIRGLNANPEDINIDIKFLDYQKLQYQRKTVLENGLRLNIFKDQRYVPAKIRHNGKTIKAEIRLKGDVTAEHLGTDKMSFRIKIKGNDALFGMNVFSIHRPGSRNHINEWVFHEALRRESVPSLRYKFINVSLNGKRLGIYALEEHFDKELIEFGQHREGVIVKYDEDLMYALGDKWGWDNETFGKAFQSSHIDGFNIKRIQKNPELYKQYKAAITLLLRFRNKELKSSEVFDIESMAKFEALCEIFGAHHSQAWYNRRFYYNPVTGKLSPVGFDAQPNSTIEYLYCNKPIWQDGANVYSGPGSFPDLLYSDYDLFAKYIEYLEKMSKTEYLTQLLNDIKEEMEENRRIICRDYPYYPFTFEPIRKNQKYIRKVLDPVKAIHAYFKEELSGLIHIEAGNIHELPVKILSLSLPGGQTAQPVQETVLGHAKASKPVKFETVAFSLPNSVTWNEDMKNNLEINYTVLGAHQTRKEEVFSWSYSDCGIGKEDFMRQKANHLSFDFLKVNDKNKTITVSPGDWIISRNMIIPPGYTLMAGAGVTLNLNDSAKILSYSPIYFVTTKNGDPIHIHSSDSKGQGIIVLNAGTKSTIKNVFFENLSAPKEGMWELTGSVTFYGSPVEIHSSQFYNNRDSDDALNIIRSDFSIINSIFSTTFADAIDADFSDGTIRECSFVKIGNDAVDMSGSSVVIEKTTINGAGDKGISAGEKSQVYLSDVIIKRAKIGIASKDKSYVNTKREEISECEVAYGVYQKKPEYGPAEIYSQSSMVSSNLKLYMVEQNSVMVRDGKTIVGDQKNLGTSLK